MTIEEIEERWRTYTGYNWKITNAIDDIDWLLSEVKRLKSEYYMVEGVRVGMLEEEVKRLREVIEKVLAWRNFDGDGISDPLREELYKLSEEIGQCEPAQ